MEFNRLLFPAPKPSYSANLFPGEFIAIPRKVSKGPTPIPCLFLSTARGSSKTMIYFHGNAEDLGMSYELLCHLSSALRMHVIGVEYPGYGIYKGKCTEKKILSDSGDIYNYLTQVMGVKGEDIILFGRSIGTGPATWLASEKKVGGLLLMSGYTCIREVAKSIAGKVFMYFIKDRFRNIDWIKKVTVPVFIVHGQSDTLIPYDQSIRLYKNCNSPSSLLLPESMNHNEFDFFDDLTIPFSIFLTQCGITYEFGPDNGFIKFPADIFFQYDKPEDSTLRSETFNE